MGESSGQVGRGTGLNVDGNQHARFESARLQQQNQWVKRLIVRVTGGTTTRQTHQETVSGLMVGMQRGSSKLDQVDCWLSETQLASVGRSPDSRYRYRGLDRVDLLFERPREYSRQMFLACVVLSAAFPARKVFRRSILPHISAALTVFSAL